MAAAQIPLGLWARQHGIDARSLNGWRTALFRRERAQRQLTGRGLVEVVPRKAVKTSSARYALAVGDVRLEVESDFEESTLRRLLAVLRSC
jgi:hypothetical protein